MPPALQCRQRSGPVRPDSFSSYGSRHPAAVLYKSTCWRDPATPTHLHDRARHLLPRQAIILVAGVAGISHGRNCGPQAVDRALRLIAVVGDDLAKSRRLSIEVGFVRPDLRRCARLLAALRV